MPRLRYARKHTHTTQRPQQFRSQFHPNSPQGGKCLCVWHDAAGKPRQAQSLPNGILNGSKPPFPTVKHCAVVLGWQKFPTISGLSGMSVFIPAQLNLAQTSALYRQKPLDLIALSNAGTTSLCSACTVFSERIIIPIIPIIIIIINFINIIIGNDLPQVFTPCSG